MKVWLKWGLIAIATIILAIFFGTIVFNLAGYLLDFTSTLFSWLADAVRWLAKVFDIFGFGGIF